MPVPVTRYVKSDDVQIAYQVVGDGPEDLLLVPGFVSNIDLAWQNAASANFLKRLASFSRLILFDKRGTGMSDRGSGNFTLEQRMHDVRAVLDDVGSQSATLLGVSEGGPMSLLYSATYPERTKSLILYGTYAKRSAAPDYTMGWTEERWDRVLTSFEQNWGTPQGVSLDLWAPSVPPDSPVAHELAAYFRSAASPGAATAIMRMNRDIDVRAILPSIHVPTLVLHRTQERVIPVQCGRFLAEHIDGARLVELDGQDHIFWIGDSDHLLAQIEEFVTGSRVLQESRRILTTVLFVDIVSSTERAVVMGDQAWREVLQQFSDRVRAALRTHVGEELDNAGDGFFASFDGPARAVRCASAIIQAVSSLGLSVRCGVHTGECEIAGDKLAGIAVHMGARISAAAEPDQVWVSRTVCDLVVGSGLTFEDRGEHTLKGIPGSWQLFCAHTD